MEKAIFIVMNYYQISRETAINLYWDEIEAYMQLQNHGVE
jgi:hypothetical protein